MTTQRLIVGLGNPGPKYEATRHNLGFLVLNRLAHDLGATTWKQERGVQVASVSGHWLIEPQEYMNRSGESVRDWLAYKHLTVDPKVLVVVHDDLDFPLGEVHEQSDRSAGGHNGVQSMIDALGTQAFRRIRIGIGNNRDLNIPGEDYVLQPFSDDERPTIDQAIVDVVARLKKDIDQQPPE